MFLAQNAGNASGASAITGPKDLSVTFEVVDGLNIISKDKNGKSDPFCSVSFRGVKKSTKVLAQTSMPIWKEQFPLGSFGADDTIEVSCWDKDNTSEPLGSFTIKLGDFMKAGEHTKSLLLEPRTTKPDQVKGKLTIKLHVSVSAPHLKREMPTKKTSEENFENSTDKAFVRRKLTGWLKIRPDKDKMEEKLRQLGVITEETSTKMFGASLDEVMNRQKKSHPGVTVPIFLHQLIDKLLNDPSTFNEAGLFRISGSAAVVSKVKATVDAGQTPDLSPLSRDDAASLLKEYIRQLPEPLFTWKLSDQWKAVGDEQDEKGLIATARQLLRKLPGHNRHLWHAVNSFLYKLSLQSDVNKMTPENIGIVIGPNVLWERDTRLPVMNMNWVVANLVRHYNEVFHDWDTWLESYNSDPKMRSGSKIETAVKKTPKGGKPLEDWAIEDVTKWLNDKGFGQYADAFVKQNFDGKALMKLTADQLLEECQIQSLGHRKKIIFRRDDLVKAS